MEYIRGLPINDTPEIFGLHNNANITFAVNETYQLLNGIVKLQPKSKSGGGRSQEEVQYRTFGVGYKSLKALWVNLPGYRRRESVSQLAKGQVSTLCTCVTLGSWAFTTSPPEILWV